VGRKQDRGRVLATQEIGAYRIVDCARRRDLRRQLRTHVCRLVRTRRARLRESREHLSTHTGRTHSKERAQGIVVGSWDTATLQIVV
jgi:hypothetical protein